MIPANELRIGNWAYGVMYPNQPLQIKTIHENIVHLGEHINGYDSLEPIPLTPEILGKCGFKIDYEGDHMLFFNGRIYYYGNGFLMKDFSVKTKLNQFQIKHLHQLQNLYFALTGEELTFKP